jgi:hypothetical protein
VCAVILTCVVLHEAGHALAGIATGGKIVHFEVFSLRPKVRVRGGAADADSFRALAGSGLVVAAWLVMTVATLKRPRGLAMQTASFFCGIELLAWTLSAALHPFTPQRNDAGLFLALSGVNPAAVAAFCVAAGIAGASLMCHGGAPRRRPGGT